MLFEVLIRRYNALLYKIARSYGFNHEDAEDLMQESHFSAYKSLRTFRADASYKTWLTKIHINGCYHKLNQHAIHYEEATDDVINHHTTVTPTIGENQQTEQMVMNKELGRVLEESLQQLPLVYRSVFVLREIEGFSVAEAADLLSITPVNVKVRLNRAKTMLQKQLEKFYSVADLYEFHLMYCDKIVRNVFERIAREQAEGANHDTI
ncbi:sigma-70 family RNA polymerase sigma factor [Chitinophaga ginsengisoli]|uniref:RNA polymerase sigma-70 factor (ECF subfamily) n=1 Tax=Chitinophaga ginsengisoli TaxID=363837 RepID=A0A2P8GKM1_9BACT|nr:sigma-70 family RNA polymerase sigma factor [Chitinophaga ginsengisoli]PSL34502.1 RNA polymerase sigma-70 factor (ECF subfamily) [Chitinophaga ginsengisoli]